MDSQDVVRQACIRGMWEGEFTEEVEWMSWVLEDQGVGDMQRWGRGQRWSKHA